MKSPELSIVILNYNTKNLVLDCINSVIKNTKNLKYEIIVIDNASTDGSIDALSNLSLKSYKLIANKANLGFSKGNNQARKIAKGKYILFLNSDTIVDSNAITNTLRYLKSNSNIGAITCKLVTPSGKLDKDARRSFPTPWVALTHFSYLDRLFPKSKIFSRYWYGYISSKNIQEVDALEGAFFLSPRKVLDKVNWFDEDYFLNGEDIDLSWKIKNAGYVNIYYPKEKIIHLKGASKGKKMYVTLSGINAMEIFYKKRLQGNYPIFINLLVFLGLRTLKIIRIIKVAIS